MADTQKLMQSRLFAMGIAVSDLEVSTAFYRDVLGLDEVNRISLPNMEEVVLQYPGADHKVVLMKFTDGKDRNVTRLPVKLVFQFANVMETAKAIRDAGHQVVKEPERVPEIHNAIIGFARDPDGYLIELLQSYTPAE